MELFEFAIIKNEKRDKDGEVTEKAILIQEPTHVLAQDAKTAGVLAARAIPEEQLEDIDRIAVLVRPFSG